MKATLLGFVVAMTLAHQSSAQTTLAAQWRALSMLESGDDDSAIGAVGEVGRYQVLPAVWKEYHGGNPTDPKEALRVAVEIMADRVGIFSKQHNREPSHTEFYLLWNCPANVMKPGRRSRERAERFASLLKLYSK